MLIIGDRLRTLIGLISQQAGRAYVVGGAIRTALLGNNSIRDIDIVVHDDPLEVCRRITESSELGLSVVKLDKKRDVFRLIIRDSADTFVDISRIKEGSISENLRARDFTINAIALPIERFLSSELECVRDPLKGYNDLKDGILRMCSNRSFSEDPLRILRAFRFKTHLNMNIEKATLSSAVGAIHGLTTVSGERIRDELTMTLAAPGAAKILVEMESLGMLEYIFPNLHNMKDCAQNEHHHLDVWGHTIESIEMFEAITQDISFWLGPHSSKATRYLISEPTAGRPRNFLIKLSLLFHDSGKPASSFMDKGGRIRFSGHEKLSANIFEQSTERLHFSNSEKSICVTMIKAHMRASILTDPDCTKRAMYRLIGFIGDELIGLCLLFLSDTEATRGALSSKESRRRARQGVLNILDYADSLKNLPPKRILTGNDLMDIFGIKEGPMIGAILRRVDEAMATGRAQTKEEAIEEARLAMDSLK